MEKMKCGHVCQTEKGWSENKQCYLFSPRVQLTKTIFKKKVTDLNLDVDFFDGRRYVRMYVDIPEASF
jgi:hypothetical protein